MEKFAVAKGLKRVPGPDPQYEDICFGTAPLHTDLEGLSAVFPSMEVQFDQVRRRKDEPQRCSRGSVAAEAATKLQQGRRLHQRACPPL